jgi:ribosome recycling factor
MDIREIISQKDGQFEKAIIHFQEEAAKIRTGRANPSLVENLLVDYYGQKTPLKQMAAISIPEARQIMIQPWDRESLTQIEAAIRESDLGLNPSNDGLGIRLTLPQLNEDTRRDLVKVLNQRAEEGRIAIRGLREELWKEIQDLEKGGEIAEDDKFTGKELLQKKVDDCNQKIEDIRKKKEADILTV